MGNSESTAGVEQPLGIVRRSSSNDLILATEGMKDTMDFRVYALDGGKKANVSMWHDINLYPPEIKDAKSKHIVNMICEVSENSK